MRRLQHDGRHRRLDAIKQARHQRHIAKGDIHPRQHDENQQRGQHKQRAGHHAAPGAMHEPANIGGELLRLGAGQHHAVIERMQKAPLGEPATALDQLLVHDRDLPGRPAKADETKLKPEQQRLAKADRRGRRVVGIDSARGRVHAGFAPLSKLVSKASNTPPATASSASSSAMASRSPASTLSTPAASGGCTPPTSR